MKSNGTYRRLITAFVAMAGFMRGLKWWGKSGTYADPSLTDPYYRHRSRAGTTINRTGNKRLQMPDCVPGTITHKDWLVKELGYDRNLADGYYYAFLNGYKVRMPMLSDLVAS